MFRTALLTLLAGAVGSGASAAREAGQRAVVPGEGPGIRLPQPRAVLSGIRKSAARVRRGLLQRQVQVADVKQPEFVGSWKKARTHNMDPFLDRAMGVPWMQRRLAVKGKQKQVLTMRGGTIYMVQTDARGSKTHEMIPNGKLVRGKGFMSLPVERRVRWAKPGKVLVMDERYAVCLGGDEHNQARASQSARARAPRALSRRAASAAQKCSGGSCPVVRSTRSVVNKEMVVELERRLPSGEVSRDLPRSKISPPRSPKIGEVPAGGMGGGRRTSCAPRR